MPAAWIETPAAVVRLRSERLEVTLPPPADGDGHATPPAHAMVDLPLGEIERLIVAEEVRLTFPALCEVLRREIPVVIHDWRGRLLGSFLPPASPHSALRLRQYQRTWEPEFQTLLSRRLIQTKIKNQRRLLQRLHATRPRPVVPGALDRMAACLADTNRATDVPALRGLEGAAAALYWPAWAAFLPEDHPFERRSTRPPHNPVNAVLSYLSALVYGEVLAACHRRGLDPGLGCLHPTTDRRWSLALDLMEPFRPAILEATAIRLFTHRMLDAGHFQPVEGGIHLSPSGRRTVIHQFETRLQREFESEHAGHRTTLRRQIEATVLAYRMALETPESFQPFLMN